MPNEHFLVRERCPICHSENTSEVFSRSYDEDSVKRHLVELYAPFGSVAFGLLEGHSFVVVECNQCGGFFQKEVLDEKTSCEVHEDWVDPGKMLSYLDEKRNLRMHKYEYEIKMIVDYLGRPPGELRFMDFGMGWGLWCMTAKRLGVIADGYEVSRPCIEYAQAHGINSFGPGDLTKETYDFVNVEQVFEHLVNPLETLQSIGSLLKQDGLVKISTPECTDLKRRLIVGDWNAPKESRNSLNLTSPLDHINCFTPVSMSRMIALAGFSEVRIPIRCHIRASLSVLRSPRTFADALPITLTMFPRKRTYVFCRRQATD